MHIHIVYAHPAEDSFNRRVLHSFIRGIEQKGHTYRVRDLYRENWTSSLTEEHYNRETAMDKDLPVPLDVQSEQNALETSDALVFIYPLWWSDCPAILKGWFDRVWTHGYAYYYNSDNQKQSRISVKKSLVLCSAGHSEEHLQETGLAESIRRIMVGDRLENVGIRENKMVFLGPVLPGQKEGHEELLERVYREALKL